MNPGWTRAAAWLVCTSAGPSFASGLAEQLLEPLALSGSLRAAYWSSSQNLGDNRHIPATALWLKTEPRLHEQLALVAEGWLMNDDAVTGGRRQSRLREGYLSASAGDFDLRVGKQLIVWGRADRLNPTDNLTPRDYTLPVAEDDDQRFGAYAARLDYHWRDWSLTTIWLPKFQPNVIPLPQQSGLQFHEPVPDSQQAAIKLERSGGEVDWSLSYFHGLDPNPDLSLAGFGPRGVDVRLNHHRYRVFGADAATVVGRYALRAEASYSLTEDENGDDPFVKNPFFYLVAGGDRSFFDNFNVNLQYYFRHVSHYREPGRMENPALQAVALQQAVISNQALADQHGLTCRIANKWFNETLEAELAGVVGFSREEYVVKPKLIYAFDDHLKGTLGGNLFGGEVTAFYNRISDNSTLFAELKYSF